MERELGLPVEPAIVLPRSNNAYANKPTIRSRFRAWLSGTPP